MSKTCKTFLKCCAIMLCCILIGFSSMVAVSTIPTDKLRQNVAESLTTFEREGVYFTIQETYNSRLDNFTDSLMMGIAVFSGENGAVDDAMNNYVIANKDADNIQALRSYINNEPTGFYSYGRYWHGYLVILKPLLLIFSYPEIRSLNSFFQLVLMLMLMLGLHKRNMTRFCIPLMVSWYIMCPPAIMLSIQFSTVFYITFIASLLIVYFHEYIEKFGYIPFFLLLGAVTSFFDLLTYPVLSVIVPLTFLFILRKNEEVTFLSLTGDIVAHGASWGIGYGAMWASKWLIATVVTETNFITESMNQVQWRTGNISLEGETLVITDGLERCIELLQLPQNKFVLSGCLFLLLFILVKNRRSSCYSVLRMYPFVFLAIVPVIWLIVTCNHSFIHFWFTYRNLAATIFALFAGLLVQIHSPKRGEI